MDKQFEKIDDKTIRFIKTMPVAVDFELDYLVEQRERIIAQKAKDNAQRDLEIAECDELIAQCEILSIVSKKATEAPAPEVTP